MSYGWINELSAASMPFMQVVENIEGDDMGGWREGSASAIEDANVTLHGVGVTYEELSRLVKAIQGVLENEI